MSSRPTTNTGPKPKAGAKKPDPRRTYGTETKVSRRAAEAARRQQRQRMGFFIALLVVLVVGGGVLGVVLAGGKSKSNPGNTAPAAAAPATPTGPEGVEVPAGDPLAASGATGNTIDGVQCGSSEQLAYHIHTHVQIFVSGTQVQIPAGVGILNPQTTQQQGSDYVGSGTCLYWLHTHAADGIIHVESPSKNLYTLGTFFDIWHQPLSTGAVGPDSGPVTVYVDGKAYTGNPRDIQLQDKEQIQIDVGTPAPPYKAITFPDNL